MEAFVDFVINGEDGPKGHGPVGQRLEEVRFEPGLLRPYIDNKGVQCVTVNTGRMVVNAQGLYVPERKKITVKHLRDHNIEVPILNAGAMRPAQWTVIDDAVVEAFRMRLVAWNHLMSRNPTTGTGMGKLTYEYAASNDPGEAIIDMTGMAPGRNDKQLTKIRSVPLPIIRVNFSIPTRLLAVSRNSPNAMDRSLPAFAGRRIAEALEQLVTGGTDGIAFGTRTAGLDAHDGLSKIYGLTSSPYRLTKSNLSTPDGSAPGNVLNEVLAMREQARAKGFYGPYRLYFSSAYAQYMDADYFRTGTAMSLTLRQRLEAIPDIGTVEELPYLSTTGAFRLVLVQDSDDVMQGIEGLSLNTVVWESKGGFEVNFMTFMIGAPLVKADYAGYTGIVDATTA